jgi:FtsZ-interacting cell division protein ZipA
MPELRWALIGLGVLFLAGLALWEWRRGRRFPKPGVRAESVGDITLTTERPRRIEPGLDEVMGALSSRSEEKLEVPSIRMEMVPVSTESAVDVPGLATARGGTTASKRIVALDDEPFEAASPVAHGLDAESSGAESVRASIEPVFTATEPAYDAESSGSEPSRAPPPHPAQPRTDQPRAESPKLSASQTNPALTTVRWPPSRSERVLTLRIVKPDGEPLPGRALRGALESAGLAPGPQTIYHRADMAGEVIVSAANLVRPGKLDPAHMDAEEFRGVSLFSVLPGPLPAVRMLEELVASARSIAHRLGAVVQDEKGEDLDGMRLTELRRSLPEAHGDGHA